MNNYKSCTKLIKYTSRKIIDNPLFQFCTLFYLILFVNMQLSVIAPCPKKPSTVPTVGSNQLESKHIDMGDVEDACLELQQILQSQTRHLFQQQQQFLYTYPNTIDEHFITRTGNPLIQDSSFFPLHQAVSQLHVTDTNGRPRSYSVDDTRNHYIAQPIPCKPVY